MPSGASAGSVSDPGQKVNPPGPRTKAGKVGRVLELIRVLERERKITKTRLFELLEVRSESSFKRVKAQLAHAGLPLRYDRNDKHFHLPANASVARYGVDPRTRAQLAQVRAAVAALGGPIADAIDDVLEVFEARIALDDPEAEAVVSSRHPQPRGGKTFYETLDRALTALREHRWLSFSYRRTDGAGRDARTVQPYGIHAHDGRYYLWAVAEGETQPKLYALDGIDDAAIENDAFEPDAGLHLNDALRHSFGTMVGDAAPVRVVVRVEPAAAAFARCRRWPAQIDNAELDDGAFELTFEVTRFEELVAWVLSFGGTATIVSPLEARLALHSAAQRAVDASP